MSLDLEQALLLLILVVPGFIVSSIQRAFGARNYSSQFEWFVSSVILSILLNFTVSASYVLFDMMPFNTYKEVLKQLPEIKIFHIVIYAAIVYISAVVFGILSGKWQTSSLRRLAVKLGLTSYAPNSSVWDRLFEKQVPDNRRRIWIRTTINQGTEIFGRLRHSSEIVEQDKPIEIYVSPFYVLHDGAWKKSSINKNEYPSDGIYLKVSNEGNVQFYFRNDDWIPPNS